MITVEMAVIWLHPKTGRWMFSVIAVKRRKFGKKFRLDYSTPLPV